MKIKELRTYQAVRLAGSLGSVDFISNAHGPTSKYEMEVVQGLGVKVSYPYHSSSGVLETDTMIIPFTNIGYMKPAEEKKAAVKAK